MIARRASALVALAVVLLAGAAWSGAGIGAVAGNDAFTGVWVGIESPIGDGSTDTMGITRPRDDGTRNWIYYETNASGYCSGGPLSARGTARAVGDTLTVTVTLTHCSNGSAGTFPPPFDLTMTATQDGHIDWAGVIFSRKGGWL